MELVLRKGFNAADAQGFRMNFNNQRDLSTNLRVSRQHHLARHPRQQQGQCLQHPTVSADRRRQLGAGRQLPEGGASSRSTTRPRNPSTSS